MSLWIEFLLLSTESTLTAVYIIRQLTVIWTKKVPRQAALKLVRLAPLSQVFPSFCPTILLLYLAFCLLSARWLPQIWTSPPHTIMFKGKWQAPFVEERKIFQSPNRHFFKSQPKLGLRTTLSCSESLERENIWLSQSWSVRRRYKLGRRGLWMAVGI